MPRAGHVTNRTRAWFPVARAIAFIEACMAADPLQFVLDRLQTEMGCLGLEFYPFKVDYPT